MEYTQADLADKYTILLIKQAHGLTTEENLALMAIELKRVSLDKLYEINGQMWELEEQISQENNLERIGALYLRLRRLTLRRNAEKNKIAHQFDEPVEWKRY